MVIRTVALGVLALGLLLLWREMPPADRDSEAAGAPAAAAVRWVDCWFESSWRADVRCGELSTGARAGGFTLPFVVLVDRSADRRPDPLIHLAGGPGSATQGSGEQVQRWLDWLERANLSRDLILFDQRGTGASRPQWQCRDYDRLSRRILAEDIALQAEFRRGLALLRDCWSQLPERGYRAEYFSTRANADDVLLLLRELGYARWNLFGVSYGTRLALEIAGRRPPGLRSAVLDSVYPLDKGLLSEWPWLLAHALERLWQQCRSGGLLQCDAAGGPIQEQFWRQMRALKRQPRTLTVNSWYGQAPYKVVVNDHRFLSIVFSALYDAYTIEKIPRVLSELQAGKTAVLADLTETFVNYSLEPDFNTIAYFSVECADNPLVSREQYRAVVQRFPELAAYTRDGWDYDFCRYLAGAGGARAVADAAALDYPMLLLSGGLDPVTPPQWAQELARQLPRSQSLLFARVGHAVVSSDDCAHGLLRAYLDNPDRKLAADCAAAAGLPAAP